MFLSIYLGINFVILFFLIFFSVMVPRLTLPTIQFGVRIPDNRTSDSRIIEIRRKYTTRILIYSIPIILLIVLFYRSYILSLIMIILWFPAYLTAYLQSHYALLKIQNKEDWYSGVTQVSYAPVSTSQRKHVFLVFVPMVLIAAITIAIGIEVYPTLPNIIPIHFALNGKPNGFAVKSYISVLTLPILQFVLFAIFLSTGYLTSIAKMNISASSPKNSYITQVMFRNRIIYTLALIGVMVEITLSAGAFSEWDIMSGKFVFPIIISLILLSLVVITIFSIKYGQMGNRKLRDLPDDSTSSEKITNVNDNRYWKWGMVYVNREDKSILVPKRFGVGYTINLGNAKSVLIFALLISLPIAVIVVLILV